MLCFVRVWTIGTDPHLESEGTLFQMFSLLVGIIIQKLPQLYEILQSGPDFLFNKSLPLALC